MRRLSMLMCISLISCTPPTGLEPPELKHPNELLMFELLQCNAQFHEIGPLRLFWRERIYLTTPDGKLGFVACAAFPYSDVVKCDQRWVRETTRVGLYEAASHEVCHIIGNLNEPPLECMIPAWEVCR